MNESLSTDEIIFSVLSSSRDLLIEKINMWFDLLEPSSSLNYFLLIFAG